MKMLNERYIKAYVLKDATGLSPLKKFKDMP